jgi:Flp pilus assembly protein TadD
MNYRKQHVALMLTMVMVCVAVFICGCNNEGTASKSKPFYSKSEADLAFDKGANQPPSIRTLYVMADIMVKQGREDQAEAVLTRLINEHPGFTPAYNSLAELKMRHRRTDEAVKILEKGLAVDSKDPVLLNNLGMCWMIKQKYEKALKYFTEAAGVNPESTRYRANMAVALGFMGRDNEALALYRQILSEKQAAHNLEIIQSARETHTGNIPVEAEHSDSQ